MSSNKKAEIGNKLTGIKFGKTGVEAKRERDMKFKRDNNRRLYSK